jgi:hypothetical protein
MRSITVNKWSVTAAGAALAATAALAFSMPTATAADTMTVHVKQASLADHAADCGDGGIVSAHFILNQIGSARPDSITVDFSDNTSSEVSLLKLSGPTAHYLANTGGALVTDATAVVPSTWTGQFVLSHYVCGTTTTTTTTSSSSTTSSGTPTS